MGQWLAIIFVLLVALAYAFIGVGWLIHHELPYVILFFVAIVVIFLIYLYIGGSADERKKASGSSLTPDAARRIVVQARQAERRLSEVRDALERETEKLNQLHLNAYDEARFEFLVQRHHESRLVADSWYTHKRSAVETRTIISGGLSEFREKKRQFARMRDASSLARRQSIVHELNATQALIDELYAALSSLNETIRLGSNRLDVYNDRTRKLKLHIAHHCGERGRLWHERLEARTHRRKAPNN